MLHACVERFDVTENLENFLVLGWTKQGLTEVIVVIVRFLPRKRKYKMKLVQIYLPLVTSIAFISFMFVLPHIRPNS